jgi:hypothetical protein
MHRTRLILAAAVVGAAGFFTLTWAQTAAPPSTTPRPGRGGPGGYAPARVELPGAGQPFSVYVAHGGHPEDAQLNQEINENVAKFSKATDTTAKADLEKEIKTALGKQFDSRQAGREQELKDLEERVTKLREQLKKRQEAKDEIVNSRFDELIKASSGLGWGEESGPHGAAYGFFTTPQSAPARIPNAPPPVRP